MSTTSRRNAIVTMAGALTFASMSPWEQELIADESSERIRADKQKASEEAGSFPIRILLNENPLGCSPFATQAAIEAVHRAHFYPFDLSINLANKLRAKHGLPLLPVPIGLSSKIQPDTNSHSLTLAGGSSELLFSVAHAFTLDGGNIVEADPSYQALGVFAQKRPGPSVELRRIPLLTDGSIDQSKMLNAIDKETKILVITNPNNPTGTALPKGGIGEFIAKVPSHVLVVVDEAYIDFLESAESHTAIPIAMERENVLITRTFSKIHGLAGLRIGYAIGHRSVIERMQPFRVGSFSLNVCGVSAAIASLDDVAHQEKSRRLAEESRTRLSATLKKAGFHVCQSDAACVWADWGKDTSELLGELSERGVLVASGIRWDRPNCLRVSVGTPWQTTKFIETLGEVL